MMRLIIKIKIKMTVLLNDQVGDNTGVSCNSVG